jgi:hypothetical protein
MDYCNDWLILFFPQSGSKIKFVFSEVQIEPVTSQSITIMLIIPKSRKNPNPALENHLTIKIF